MKIQNRNNRKDGKDMRNGLGGSVYVCSGSGNCKGAVVNDMELFLEAIKY